MAEDGAAPGDGDLTEPTEAPEGAGEPEAVEVSEEPAAGRDTTPRRWSPVQWTTAAGLVIVVALAAVAGWLGFRAYESRQAQDERARYLQVGRQAAVNLTTIDWQQAEGDVQRILDSATGAFRDDFQQRVEPFVDVVKQAQSASVGTVTEAGVESETENGAEVLVAVTVETSDASGADQYPRGWRMRISVQDTDDGAKVSNVEFVS